MTNVQRTTNQLFPGGQRHRQRLKAYENNGFSLADVRPPTKTIFISGQAKKAASENNFHSRHLNRPTSENVFRKKIKIKVPKSLSEIHKSIKQERAAIVIVRYRRRAEPSATLVT